MKRWVTFIWVAIGFSLTLEALPEVLPGDDWSAIKASVIDFESGKPVACTVKIIDANRQPVLEDAAFGDGFRCSGYFEKRLPPGKTRLLISRGWETQLEFRELELVPGQVAELQFRLQRQINLRALHWYSGDHHAHMIHGEKNLATTFAQAALAAQAEDLQYLSVAQSWPLAHPTAAILQQTLGALSTPECAVNWNLEAPKNYYRGDASRCLGQCWNVGMKPRTPWGEDVLSVLLAASAQDYESQKPPYANFESHAMIHALGGVACYTHPARWWTGVWGGEGGYPRETQKFISNLAVELPLDTLIGPTYDGIDVITGRGEQHADALAFQIWCLLQNHGYRLTPTASSDACFDRRNGAVPGSARLYTYQKNGFSWQDRARAIAQGRTVATSGPLLVAMVDSKPPGTAFAADGKKHTLNLEAWASGASPKGLASIEVLRNGILFWTNEINGQLTSYSQALSLVETQRAWYCVRLWGDAAEKTCAVSGAFYFQTEPYRRPPIVPAQVEVSLRDAQSGDWLSGKILTASFANNWKRNPQSAIPVSGTRRLKLPATFRLRAEVPGYEPLMLSPFLDNPDLLRVVTQLKAEDLADWATYERIRQLLGEVKLEFRLKRRR